MNDLSFVAQAVLDAFLGDAENTSLQMDDLRENVAAALRAAVDQVVPPGLEEEYHDRNQALPLTSMVQICQKFLVIADELDGVKYGTYRCNLKEK